MSKESLMSLNILSIIFKYLIVFCILAFHMAFWGCSPAILRPTSTPRPPETSQVEIFGETPETSEETREKPSPRALAALQLTEQGRMYLGKNQPDDAIDILEQSLNLNPGNGRNYYYLAEAWLMKGNLGQAREFNRLAEVYLKDEREWLDRVIRQRERIRSRGQ